MLTCVACFYSADSVKEDTASLGGLHGDVLTDYLAMQNEPGIPPHCLMLKQDAICTIARNLNLETGLVKNARVIVRQINNYSIEVEVLPLRAQQQGQPAPTYLLSRIVFEFVPFRTSWTVQRLQYPLRLAYATTFNSCQGLTLDQVVYDLRCPVFAHGQLYTALTRVRHRDHARVVFAEGNHLGETNNVVSPELLL